jgi:hypothetical protein
MEPSLLIKWGMDPAKVPPPMQHSLEPIIRFFGFHDSHPVALTMSLLEKFGSEWFEWEPDTLRSEIVMSFQTTNVSEHNWQKIQAVRTLTTTVGFWTEWHIFEKVIQALNNNIPRFDICQRCTLAQLMAGVDIANTIRVEKYGWEIEAYIAACALDEGVVYVPPPLDFAQRLLSSPKYECPECGAIDSDDIDGRCDFCCGRFQHEHPLSMKPSPFVGKDAGTKVRHFLERDPAPIKARFEELKAGGIENFTLSDESPEDVQASKLMVAYRYMQHRQSQLVDQLEELKTWVSHG